MSVSLFPLFGVIVELGGTSTDIGGWLDPHAATATWVLPLAGSALEGPTCYDVPPVETLRGLRSYPRISQSELQSPLVDCTAVVGLNQKKGP